MPQIPDLPRLLLVEDSDEDAATIREALERSGIPASLQRVMTGDGCMDALRDAASPPALVILGTTPFTSASWSRVSMPCSPR